MQLGNLGVWAPLDGAISGLEGADSAGGPASAHDTALFAKRVEALGYAALWSPEGFGRNPLVHSAWLLANTTTLIAATGIANIYARDAMAMASARATLNEQSDGRFLLGMGVSHGPIVEKVRGHDYGKPVAAMRNYIDAMDKSPYVAKASAERPLTVLAALREKMLALSAERADGAHPYNVTPEHSAMARKVLGPGKLLCVEQKLILSTDAAAARATARAAISLYLPLPNYRNCWKEQGYTDADLDGNGSDRFIDGIFAWGDEAALRKRIQEHLDAGADHVCIQAIAADGGIDMRIIELLAPEK